MMIIINLRTRISLIMMMMMMISNRSLTSTIYNLIIVIDGKTKQKKSFNSFSILEGGNYQRIWLEFISDCNPNQIIHRLLINLSIDHRSSISFSHLFHTLSINRFVIYRWNKNEKSRKMFVIHNYREGLSPLLWLIVCSNRWC